MFANKGEFLGNRGDVFVLQIDTSKQGVTSSTQFRLPLIGSYTVNWGDGIEENHINTSTHTYSTSGVYVLQITGNPTSINFYRPISLPAQSDAYKVLGINSWGNIAWQNMESSFENCQTLGYINSISVPNFTATNSLQRMFFGCFSLNSNLNYWDTSNITNLKNMFAGADVFNQALDQWNVSKVTNFEGMFLGADRFNQSLNSWNMSSATNVSYMFQNANDFNQNLNSWNLSNVTNTSYMFYVARNFNGDISSWDVSNVTNMANMFGGAEKFNQNISTWNVSKVTDMQGLFFGATLFNQNLETWNLNTQTRYTTSTSIIMNSIFRSSGMSTENYSKTLIGWANKVYNNSAPKDVDMSNQIGMSYNNTNYGGTPFNNAYAARAYLSTSTGGAWVISGDTAV